MATATNTVGDKVTEKFIYPMESVQLPAGAKPEGDLWTIIHNTHNIK